MGRRELLRINAKLKVEFKNFDRFYEEYTKNISNGGIFIKTRNVLRIQDVVELALHLPGRDKPLRLVGEVVHVVEPDIADAHGWTPGMGVHFVDFEEGAKQELEKYIASQINKKPDAITPDRRKYPRASVRLRVRFPSVDVFREDYAKDISRGGIFIQTEKPKKVGEKFVLILVHPQTGQELELFGEVVRVTHEDPKVPNSVTGMGIKFLGLDEEKRQEIADFLNIE